MTRTSSTSGLETRSAQEEAEFDSTNRDNYTGSREQNETVTTVSVPKQLKSQSGTKFLILRAGDLSEMKFTYDFEREREQEIIRRLNEIFG